ncbi:MAG: hypothetical protein BA873_07685, partial [Desulfobulbaceae bacterium C00003063]
MPPIQNKKFYITRLRNASLPEVAYRLRRAFLTWRLGQLLKGNTSPVKIPIIHLYDISNLELPNLKGNINQDHIKQILNGEVFSLDTDKAVLEAFEEEYRDVFFSHVRQTDKSLDIRAVWEPARLQHITELLVFAQCDRTSSLSAKAKQCAKKTLSKWITNSPFLLGPHYISVMECGLRMPVFFCCLKFLEDLSSRESRVLLDTIYLHAWWISKRLSLYSSLGNHTIAECVGLIFAGAIFRKTRGGKQWLEKGFSFLKNELKHQILEDGGPAEQSLNYHRFVLDLYWLSIDFLEKNNLFDCSDIKPRLVRGEDFLNAFQDNRGNMPLIGDSDDSYAMAPGIAPKRSKANPIKRRIKTFKHSGYTVISTEDKITFTFDHGSLGMPPLYNHGHADAMSITLAKDGEKILVDPGTYRYNGVPKWRRYFRGTRAHNTVTIDGLDQAVQETGFIWSKPFRTELMTCQEQEDVLFIEAMNNGYARLEDSVWHKRAVLFFDGTNFIIKDSFKGKGVHDFELNYHLHPDAVASKTNGFWLIDNQ